MRRDVANIPHIGIDEYSCVLVYPDRWNQIFCEFIEILTPLFRGLMGEPEKKVDIGLFADSRWAFFVDSNNPDITYIFQVRLLLVVAHEVHEAW